MNRITALAAFLLSLFDCDTGRSEHEHQRITDGVVAVHARARSAAGVTDLECLASGSGACHFHFPAACLAAGDCPPEPARRLVLAVGERRKVAGMVDFRMCAGATSAEAGAACRLPAR
jgi:hypothetical protein